MTDTIHWDDFYKVDLRVGTVIHAEPSTHAKKQAHWLHIDFGKDMGVRKSGAQITHHYQAVDLIDNQIVAVVNFLPKQIENEAKLF